MIYSEPRRRALMAVVAACVYTSPAAADTVADFYRGNTIRHYVSTNPGGGYDLRSRIFMKYFPKYVPGNPAVVVMHMPGAAGITMANWASNVAPRDGTMIGMPNMTLPMNQIITPAQVRYDATKLNWIGNLEEATLSIFTWHTSKTKTMREAMERETIMGVSTKASVLYEVLSLSNKLSAPGSRSSSATKALAWLRSSAARSRAVPLRSKTTPASRRTGCRRS